jgi:methylated-DNA-[protein]-cysteine S-methyltransferase
VQRTLPSPLGPLVARVDDGGALVELRFDEDARASEDQHPVLDEVERQLRAYFAGERLTFDLALAPEGTAFEQRVWRALADIPAGETTSYGALAATTGSVARAVGAANCKNPIAVVVPCHRVIGSDGSLTGYAGGLERKRWLLAHEAAHPPRPGRLL